jgi:hypothetical protein
MLVWNEYIVDETKQPEGENYYKYTIEVPIIVLFFCEISLLRFHLTCRLYRLLGG